MKKLLLVVAVLMTGLLSAQKIAHYNTQKVMEDYVKAQEANKALEKFQTDYRASLQKMETKIQEDNQKLQMSASTMEQWEVQQAQQDLENLYGRYQESMEKFQELFVTKQNELYQPILESINQTLKAIAEEKGYDYINAIVEGQAIYANPKYDITTLLVQKLNAAVPTAN